MHFNEIPKWDGVKSLWALCPKGTHGSGKSTVAQYLISKTTNMIPIFYPEVFFTEKTKKPIRIGTWLPEINVLMFGDYDTNCGGCDKLSKDDVIKAMGYFWATDCNLFYEGAIVTQTYATYFEEGNRLSLLAGNPTRVHLYPFLHVHPFEAIRRVFQRQSKRTQNAGGVTIWKIIEKHNSMFRWFERYKTENNLLTVLIDTELGKQHVLDKVQRMIDYVESNNHN